MASSSTAQRIDISRDPQAPSILLRLVGPNVAAYSAAERYIGSLRGFFPNEHIHDTGAESDAPSSPTTSVTLATPPPLSPTHLKSHLPITDKPDSESLDASDIRYFGSEDYRRARREIRPASGKLVPAHLDPPFLAVKDGKYHILGYYARVIFEQPAYGLDETTFRLLLDTGSNTTWVRSANYCELKADGTCAPRPDEWSAFKEHPLIFEGGLDCLDKRIQGHASTVQYDDGARALVYQFPPGADLKLMAVVECHDWNADRWHSGVRFRYIPGLAIAVNEELERDRVDGIMGLGLLPHQEDDPSSPSILQALEGQLAGPAFPDPEGLVLYIGLRPIPRNTKTTALSRYQSFAAFNKWPCSNMPVFSAEIPVKPRAVNQAFRSWDVELIKLQIKDYNRKTGTYSKPVDIPLAVSTSSAAQTSTRSRQDFRVALDTGCSVSWLPYIAVEAIAKHYDDKQTPQPLLTRRMAGVTADDQALTYLVPEGKDSEHSTVVMHFVGRKDQVVTVEVPARYFLYTDNPMTGKREGLIFALTEFEKKGFLGVNFFHSAWVALYKPNADVPYVRIAAQDHSTAGVERFQLPPMSPAP